MGDLTDKCVDGTDPPDVMIKEVLDMMIESPMCCVLLPMWRMYVLS